MDAAQCGFLIGVRPIIEYLATPFWHGMSDRSESPPTKPFPLSQEKGWYLNNGPGFS